MSKIGDWVLEMDEQSDGKFMDFIEQGEWEKAYRHLLRERSSDYQLVRAHQAWLEERRKVLKELDELAKYDEDKVNHIVEFIMKGEV